MIREMIQAAPSLCGLPAKQASELSKTLMVLWDAEIAGKKFQRQEGQTVEDRIAPGFQWRDEIQTQEGRLVFDVIYKTTVFAALSVDGNNGLSVDVAKCQKLKRHIDGMRLSLPTDVAGVLPDTDAVQVMDFWN